MSHRCDNFGIEFFSVGRVDAPGELHFGFVFLTPNDVYVIEWDVLTHEPTNF